MNAEIRHIRTPAEQGLLDAFAAVKETLPGDQHVAAERPDTLPHF
jgi:hypothetical protein